MPSVPLLLYFDREILIFLRDLKSSNMAFEPVLQFIYSYSKWVGHGAVLAVVSVSCLLVGKFINRSNLFDAGRLMLLGYAFSGIIVQIFKHIFGRARPRITLDSVFIGPSFKSGFDSFPSGHTTVVFCIAFVLSRKFPRWRYFFYGFAVFVGLERIWHGSHFLSDVFAGAILGIVCGQILTSTVAPRRLKSLYSCFK